ncbi:MAG TPA: ATP-binding protein [Methylomirabilota bacterium]|nr:ATP-binding protein [Methylomirabilota bacterium]
MSPLTPREPSLSRTFALLSLLTIALITAAQVGVQWVLLREDRLEHERTTSANTIRAEAYALLRAEDFVRWRSPEAQQRFEGFFRRALSDPEILRVKVYDGEMRVVWSDEPRLRGTRFPENASLAQALKGQTVAHIEHGGKSENVFEKGFARTVELYVPLAFSTGATPGTAAVAGVVEVYKKSERLFANIWRDRLTIVGISLAGAAALYVALFGIVHRASRQLQAQQGDLQRQTTALKAANRELRATQDQLRAAERLAAIGEVSAAVAHGIRNPLANIRAAAQVARDAPKDSGAVKRYLGAITAEVDRLDHWLRALLDVVRPFQPRLAPVEVNALVDDLLGLLRDRIARSEITLERRLAADLPRLTADEVQLQQALLGVFDNALHALPRGGMLAVQTERVDGGGRPAVRVTIQDNGEGIPADRLGRIFEPFFTTKSQGTGLGLAITKKVVEGHNGRIDIESQRGLGTTIRITLPVAGPAPEAA